MKKWKIPFLCIVAFLWTVGIAFARMSYSPSGEAEGLGQGTAILSAQIAWNVLDSTASGATVSDLAVSERTYLTVLAAIATAANNDDEITITRVPPSWNTVRFRCIGKTEGGVITHQIYFGTLGNGTDCELAKAGQLAWVIGQQGSTTTDYEVADAVTVTAYCWNKTWGSQSPDNELVAEAAIDILGADLIVVVTSAVNCDCKLLGKGV